MIVKWATIFSLGVIASPFCHVNSDTASASSPHRDDDTSASSSDPTSSSSPPESTSVNSLPENLPDKGSIIPGVYKEYLPEPVFYETVVPAIYQFQTPQWNKTEITFNNWYTCTSETVPYRYSCPVTFHMNKVIANLHVDYTGLHPVSDMRAQSIQESMNHYYKLLTENSQFCDTVQNHFSGIWTESYAIEKYLKALQGCSRGSQLHPIMERAITDYNYSIRQPFTKMENNFYNTFYKLILGSGGKNSSLDLVASALLSNTRSSLQSAVLAQYYAEKNRWLHANQDCRQNVIPQSVLTPERFNQTLSEILKMGTFEDQSELSISPRNISKYYSLPLTDCTHTQDSMVVRVLVPILKKFRKETLKLVQVHSIPFQYKDSICKVKLPNGGASEDIIGGTGPVYIYQELTRNAYPTKCKPNELCKLSEYLLDSRRSDPCVSSLLSRNDTGIRSHCDLECLPKDNYVLPSVVRVASNKFVVTGNQQTLRIACGRFTQQEKLVFIARDYVGAVLVKLSCHCRLIFSHFNVFYGGRHCDDGPQIVHSDEDPSPEEEHEPTVTPIIPFMFGDVSHGRRMRRSLEDKSYFYDNLAEGSIVNLTQILDKDRIESYVRSSEIRREKAAEERGFKGMDFYAEKLQGGESLEGSGGGVGGFFWSVFIVALIVVISLQVYIIVMFKRFQRVNYYKDERILYRVEPDGDTLG